MTATLTPSLAICQDQTVVVVGNQSVYCPSYFGLPVGERTVGGARLSVVRTRPVSIPVSLCDMGVVFSTVPLAAPCDAGITYKEGWYAGLCLQDCCALPQQNRDGVVIAVVQHSDACDVEPTTLMPPPDPVDPKDFAPSEAALNPPINYMPGRIVTRGATFFHLGFFIAGGLLCLLALATRSAPKDPPL